MAVGNAAIGGNTVLSFEGVGFASGHRRAFDAMVGDNPPTITGGYANWTPIKRPLQRSLTIFTGYDPVQMTVEVRFGRWTSAGAWLTDDDHAKAVNRHNGTGNTEDDIGSLEWMAGSNFHSGPSPAVYVWSHGTQGSDTDLIPPQYAGVAWVVTGLQWGKAIRNPNGYRILADATITLQHYLNTNPAPPPDTTVRGGYFVSTPGRDTPLLIAAAPTSRSPLVDHRILAGRICSDSKNNPCKASGIRLQGKSLSFKIRHGVAVWVPQHTGI